MRIRLYCDLYVSECWQEKKEKIIKRLVDNRLQPQVYVITLAQGEQNYLEFFSSVLLNQRIYKETELFVVGIAAGYWEAVSMIKDMTERVYKETGDANVRQFIMMRQEEFEKAGRQSRCYISFSLF